MLKLVLLNFLHEIKFSATIQVPWTQSIKLK